MLIFFSLFFFNAPATTEIYTLSLHDALPIWSEMEHHERAHHRVRRRRWCPRRGLGRRQCEPQERHDDRPGDEPADDAIDDARCYARPNSAPASDHDIEQRRGRQTDEQHAPAEPEARV